MKNKILVFAIALFASYGMYAATTTSAHTRYYNNYGNSFTFVEQGITFSIFQNGEFDFYINPRNSLHIGYSTRNLNISFNSGYNYDAYVQYDFYGAIIQIENIPIYYDYYGRVEQIGNINVNYRFGKLINLGGLHLYYDNYGYYSHHSGYINIYNRSYVYHPFHNFFAKPLFEYRVVSYKPYRHHYKPNRHKYYRDHSRNKFYKKNNKRSNNTTRQRFATRNIPKRKNARIANYYRSNSKSNSINKSRRNDYRNVNTSVKRSTQNKKSNRKTRIVTARKKNPISKRTLERKTQEKRFITKRKPIKIDERKSTTTRKPPKRSKSDSKRKRRGL